MENEETKKTEDKPQEEATKDISIVDEARAIRDEIVQQKEELKAEREKLQKAQSEELLSSSAGKPPEKTAPKEETPAEYAKKVMANNL